MAADNGEKELMIHTYCRHSDRERERREEEGMCEKRENTAKRD